MARSHRTDVRTNPGFPQGDEFEAFIEYLRDARGLDLTGRCTRRNSPPRSNVTSGRAAESSGGSSSAAHRGHPQGKGPRSGGRARPLCLLCTRLCRSLTRWRRSPAGSAPSGNACAMPAGTIGVVWPGGRPAGGPVQRAKSVAKERHSRSPRSSQDRCRLRRAVSQRGPSRLRTLPLGPRPFGRQGSEGRDRHLDPALPRAVPLA